MPDVNSQGIGGRPRGQRQQTVYIFYTAVVASGRISGMHIFALGLG